MASIDTFMEQAETDELQEHLNNGSSNIYRSNHNLPQKNKSKANTKRNNGVLGLNKLRTLKDILVDMLHSTQDSYKSLITLFKDDQADYTQKSTYESELMLRKAIHDLDVKKKNLEHALDCSSVSEIRNIFSDQFDKIEIPGLEYSASSFRKEETGNGDFFDVIKLNDDEYAFFVGDVSGKGHEAGTHAQFLQKLIHNSKNKNSPSTLFKELNDAFVKENEFRSQKYPDYTGYFSQLIYAVYNSRTGKVRFANAGTEFKYTKNKLVMTENLSNRPLGIFSGQNYDENEIELSVGDKLVLYSDGFKEDEIKQTSVVENDDFLTKAIKYSSNPEALLNSIFLSTLYINKSFADDSTCIAIQKK